MMGCAIAVATYYAVSAIHARKLFKEGYTAMNRRDYATAVRCFDEALRRPLGHYYAAYAHLDRGFSQERLHHGAEALQDYSQAIKIKPDFTEAYAYRGALHDERREQNDAFHDYSEAIRVDSNAAWPLYCRGMIFLQRKEPEKAIADFSEAIRASPNYLAGYIQRGIAYKANNDWDSALANFEAAISIDPNSSRAYVQRAYVYRHKGQTDKEISNFTEAIRINPKDKFLLEYRAKAYDRKGDVDRAIADFTALINLTQSRTRSPYEYRAREYARKGDYANALADFKQARQIEGDVGSGGKSLPWLLATCPESSFRNGKEAIAEALKDCESTHWISFNCIDTLAAAYAEDKDFEQPIAFEQQALQKDGCSAELRTEMEKRLGLYKKHQPYRDTIRSRK